MKSYKEKTVLKSIIADWKGMEKIHPFKKNLYLFIALSCLLYASVSFFFIRHLAVNLSGLYDFGLPDFFVISTLLLVASIHFVVGIVPAFQQEDIVGLRRRLSILITIGMMFFILQTLAWSELVKKDFYNLFNGISSYLLLFTGIHFLQTLAGLIMAVLLFYEYMVIEDDSVKTLIVTTNPHERAKLEVFQVYWSFIAFSWLAIFLLMLLVL